jgi:hypothetical protein
MVIEILVFAFWIICLSFYLYLTWKNVQGFHISSANNAFINFGRQPSFELRKIPSFEGEDVTIYLRRQGYEIGSTIGEGAYAIVREAYSNQHGRYVTC